VVGSERPPAFRSARLRLHCYRPGGGYKGEVSVASLSGEVGVETAASRDGDWFNLTFDVSGAASDAALGFEISADSAYPDQRRFVWATDAAAEVWIVDGDPRAYAEPEKIDPSSIVMRDSTTYVTVEGLAGLLDLALRYGTNDYVFDGAAEGTVPILTIRRGRDRLDINSDTNRIGQNVTGTTLREYTDTVFTDVDGFARDNRYHLSLGCIRRLFQVGTLVDDGGAYILPRQFVAYDTIRPVRDPADVGFSASGLAAIDRYVRGQVDDGGPSLAICIVKDGAIVKQAAYGYASKYNTRLVDGSYEPARLLPRDQWEPVTVDTRYDLASNTKMYATNYAIQRLVSEGRLELDRTIQSFPGWEAFTDAATQFTGDWIIGGPGGIEKAYPGKSTITVADLLHHTAGEPPDPQYPNLLVAGGLFYQSSNIHDRSGVIDAICRTPLIAPPHTDFLYSDVDYMILGLLVEQITGQTLDDYMREHFYVPLGLTRTTFTPLQRGFATEETAATELNGNTRDGHVSFGVFPDGTPVPICHETVQGRVHDEKAYYSMGGVSGHAGLFSTVRDMAVLAQLMLGGGLYDGRQYFTKEVAARFTTPYARDPSDADASTIGLGWRVQSATSQAYRYFDWGPSREAFGHSGWAGTLTIIDPTYGMTITILTNMRHSPVVDPPNGFAASIYPIADMVPVVARVYNALLAADE
jgi:CubicO group peptidase (beta-lactamase class C family)